MAGNKVYVQGSYVDVHDNEVVNLSIDKVGALQVGDNNKASVSISENVELPAVLAESELWQRAKEEGLVDENNQPKVSRPEAALLANELAERLNIGNKWKMFENLWRRKNMRNDYNTALDQRKSLDFQEKLKNLFS